MDNNVIIFGSPHLSGATGQALNNYIDQNKIICNYFYDCYKNSPLPCDDCGFCKNSFLCKNSDLNDFYAAFEDADRIILAFPVYNASFPAPLKALIDRMQVYYNARFCRNIKPPIKKPKKVTIISVWGSNRDYEHIILSQLSPVFTVTNCTVEEFLTVKNTDIL